MKKIKNLKINSIKFKIILTISICCLLACLITGGISIYKSSTLINAYARSELLLRTKNKSIELDSFLIKMQSNVNSLVSELERETNIDEITKNEEFKNSYVKSIPMTVEGANKNSVESFGTYVVLNPEIFGGGQGAWYLDLDENSKNIPQEITDITKFSKDDKEHVGWYYDGIENKNGIWMKPYLNKNVNVFLFSFVKPIYKNNILIGVVGMDFKVDTLKGLIEDEKINETGYFFLLDADHNYLVHPTLTQDQNMNTMSSGKYAPLLNDVNNKKTGITDCDFNGREKILGYSKLNNGYTLFANTDIDEIFEKRNDLLQLIFIVTILSICISIIAAILLGKKISKPILITKDILEDTANFDLSKEKDGILSGEGNDEISQMITSLNLVRKTLKTIVNKLQVSSKDVTEDSLNISKAMEETSISISDISKALNDLAQGVANQSKSVVEEAQVIDGLALKIDEVTNSSKIIKDSIYETNKVSQNSIKLIKQLDFEMIQNSETNTTIQKSIESLSNKSNSIGEITDVIKNIAYKINMLSLNAMLESAKADKYGKGFSVVATEIKNLANETNSSAKQIEELISKIQDEIETTNNNMQKVTISNNELSGVINLTKSDFEKILNSIKSIVTSVDTLDSNVINMNKDRDTVLSSIEEISSITEESSASTEEISASVQEQSAVIDEIFKMTEDLKSLSNELSAIVTKFKI